MLEVYSRSLYLNDHVRKTYEGFSKKFQSCLFEPKGQAALNYLLKRGIDETLIKKFSIGWCPEDAPLQGLFQNLRGRLIFPTKDEYGDLRSFSGRFPVDKEFLTTEQKSIRWWNESFNKAYFFYGLDVALENIIKKKYVILVEGQTDVISCHKHGLDIAVGLMSDDFTEPHFAKITRFTNNFILLLDGDSAGRESSKKIKSYIEERRAYGNNFNRGFNVYNISLVVNGKEYDPDEFLRKYGSAPILKKMHKMVEEKKRTVEA